MKRKYMKIRFKGGGGVYHEGIFPFVSYEGVDYIRINELMPSIPIRELVNSIQENAYLLGYITEQTWRNGRYTNAELRYLIMQHLSESTVVDTEVLTLMNYIQWHLAFEDYREATEFAASKFKNILINNGFAVLVNVENNSVSSDHFSSQHSHFYIAEPTAFINKAKEINWYEYV